MSVEVRNGYEMLESIMTPEGLQEHQVNPYSQTHTFPHRGHCKYLGSSSTALPPGSSAVEFSSRDAGFWPQGLVYSRLDVQLQVLLIMIQHRPSLLGFLQIYHQQGRVNITLI